MKSLDWLMVRRTGGGRTPHGVRGLKLEIHVAIVNTPQSHPTRGAWIEIRVSSSIISTQAVAPHTGCVD